MYLQKFDLIVSNPPYRKRQINLSDNIKKYIQYNLR